MGHRPTGIWRPSPGARWLALGNSALAVESIRTAENVATPGGTDCLDTDLPGTHDDPWARINGLDGSRVWSEGGHVASDWTRAMLGTRSRLLTVVAVLVILLVAMPIIFLVLGLVVPAAVSSLVGLIGFAGLVMALLPGRRRWR